MSWAHFGWKQFCVITAADRAKTSQYDTYGACKTGTPTGPFQDGHVDYALLRRLARPYAPAVAGNFSSSAFNDTTRIFSLAFDVDPTIAAPTELSLPALVYPQNFTVSVSPAGALVQLPRTGENATVGFMAGASASHGMAVVIEVRPV